MLAFFCQEALKQIFCVHNGLVPGFYWQGSLERSPSEISFCFFLWFYWKPRIKMSKIRIPEMKRKFEFRLFSWSVLRPIKPSMVKNCLLLFSVFTLSIYLAQDFSLRIVTVNLQGFWCMIKDEEGFWGWWRMKNLTWWKQPISRALTAF